MGAVYEIVWQRIRKSTVAHAVSLFDVVTLETNSHHARLLAPDDENGG